MVAKKPETNHFVMAHTPIYNKVKFNTYVLVVLSFIISIVFVLAAFSKLSFSEQAVTNFNKWELSTYMVWIGVIELVGAFLFLFGKTKFIGGTILSIIMFGAIIVHWRNQEPFAFQLAIIIVIWIIMGINLKLKNLK